ncbi:MAG TPA: hypothetical protein VNM69_00500 [Bacillus sp. (in: firmicutes)]|uniref:hypothetical protein n=1 Tax=Bacillus litorisediminis TaxID=2922713 RepID=UPI001FAE8D2A|nr:hypothetical protein [Bacillus litorisediminis]HWO74375.1 hypothetical protein [Bacillus sp. (in: firmicutes)]
MAKYYSGNPEHLGKPKRYIANPREMQRLLLDGKIHCFKWTFLCEWISDEPLLAGEGRLKTLMDSKKVYASNDGLYILT